jgi:hypothetical protein
MAPFSYSLIFLTHKSRKTFFDWTIKPTNSHFKSGYKAIRHNRPTLVAALAQASLASSARQRKVIACDHIHTPQVESRAVPTHASPRKQFNRLRKSSVDGGTPWGIRRTNHTILNVRR